MIRQIDLFVDQLSTKMDCNGKECYRRTGDIAFVAHQIHCPVLGIFIQRYHWMVAANNVSTRDARFRAWLPDWHVSSILFYISKCNIDHETSFAVFHNIGIADLSAQAVLCSSKT